jgi:hypothetical protein
VAEWLKAPQTCGIRRKPYRGFESFLSPPKSFAEHALPMLLAQLARDARRRQLHELGKRRVWPAGSARQQRNEPGHHHIGMAVKPAQVDRLSAAAATPPCSRPLRPSGHLPSAPKRYYLRFAFVKYSRNPAWEAKSITSKARPERMPCPPVRHDRGAPTLGFNCRLDTPHARRVRLLRKG